MERNVDPAAIKQHLLRANVSAAALARTAGVSRQVFTSVINGSSRTPWVRDRIASSIGRPYEEVWGEAHPGVDRLRVLPGLPPVTPVVNGAQGCADGAA